MLFHKSYLWLGSALKCFKFILTLYGFMENKFQFKHAVLGLTLCLIENLRTDKKGYYDEQE